MPTVLENFEIINASNILLSQKKQMETGKFTYDFRDIRRDLVISKSKQKSWISLNRSLFDSAINYTLKWSQGIDIIKGKGKISWDDLGLLLLTWFNLNPTLDK